MTALARTRTGNPRLRCTDDVLEYWAERIEQVAPASESFSYSSMICRGDRLYHYAMHFELARIIRDKRGRTRIVLLNGDIYNGASGFGPSTSSRQSDVRRVVGYANVPHVVVPFSALEGAGIHFDSIRPIHVRDDRWTIEERSSRTRPAKLARMDDPSGATTTEIGWHWDEGQRKHVHGEREVPVRVPNPNQTVPFVSNHGHAADGARLDEDGVWRWTVRRHWLGDSIFRARSTEVRTRNGHSYRVTRWATLLSSFDYQERRPLYFLCELPYGAKPNTVDEAIEALKPPEVVAALARGLNVIRQGDLFAIPTKLTKRQIRRMGSGGFTKRLRVLGTNHSVTEGIVLKGGTVLGRGVMRHEPEGWRPPDHATQKLSNTWHLLVRNTVPRNN